MACSKGGVTVWEGKFGVCGVRQGTRKGESQASNLQDRGFWFRGEGASLHSLSMLRTRRRFHICRRQNGTSVVSQTSIRPKASLKQNDARKARGFPPVQEVLQKLDQFLPLGPQHKSIVLLNVLAFIDGATAVVIKVTELHTGTEEAPAAGTSLMFLVRFLVGLLAFAPALTHQFNSKSALTSSLTSAVEDVVEPGDAGVLASASLAPVGQATVTSAQDPLTSAQNTLTSAAGAAAAAAGSLPGAVARKLTSHKMLTSAPALSLTSSPPPVSTPNGQLIPLQRMDSQLTVSQLETTVVAEGLLEGAQPGSPVESPGDKAGNDWESLYWPGMLSGVFMFLGDAGQALGLETSTADHAAVLLTGSVILVPFLEAFSGRKIGVPVWLSALLATAGMVLLEQGSDIASTVDGALWTPSMGHIVQSIPTGDWWCLTSSVAFALYMVISEEQCTRTDPLRLAAVQLATTVGLSILWEAWDLHMNGGAAGGALLLRHLAAMPWAAVLFIGVIGTGLASWMELQALQTVNPTTATLVYTTGPLWSAVLAYLALGETMDAVSCGGAALILLASVMTQVFAPPKTLRASRALAHPLGTPIESSRAVNFEVGGNKEEVGGRMDAVGGRKEEMGGRMDAVGGTMEALGGRKEIVGGRNEVVQTAIDTFVEMVHKVAERPISRTPPKLSPVRALADKPRSLSRKGVVPRLRQLFHQIRR